MIKNIRVFALIILLLSPAVFGNGLLCYTSYKKLGLSTGAVRSLMQARNSGEFVVNILSKEVNGKKQVVVLVGESHLKSEEAFDLGQDFLKHFSIRGLEGADLSKSIGGRVLGTMLHYMKIALQKLHKENFSHGSMMDASVKEEEGNWFVSNDTTKKLLEKLSVENGLEEKTLKELKKIRAEVTLTLSDGRKERREFDGVEILKHLSKSPLGKSDKPIQNIELEKDHKVGFLENIAMLHFPVMVATCAAAACATLVKFATPESMHGPLAAIQFAAAGMLGHQYVVSKLTSYFGKDSFVKYIDPMNGLGYGRNRTMAKNVEKHFSETEEDLPMLVLVGKAHIPGVLKLLQQKYGYKNQELPKPN